MFTMNRDIVKLNKTSKDIVGKKRKAPEPRKLSIDSGEILEEVYAQLGGVQGSVLYWRNHEEDFTTFFAFRQLPNSALQGLSPFGRRAEGFCFAIMPHLLFCLFHDTANEEIPQAAGKTPDT